LFTPPDPVEIEDGFFEEGLIHRTSTGVPVRSKSEVIIADALHEHGIEYAYEQKIVGSDGVEKYPDFTIEHPINGKIIWEHLGMLTNPIYRKRWERKLAWYRSQGVIPYEETEGKTATLIITRDTEEGGIKADEIRQVIEKLFPSSN
jgi:hypothetical protein